MSDDCRKRPAERAQSSASPVMARCGLETISHENRGPACGRKQDNRWLRRICLVLAGFETVLLTLYVGIMLSVTHSSDPLSRAIGGGMASLAAVPFVALALPALVLAVLDRWLLTALVLASLVVPVSILLWRTA